MGTEAGESQCQQAAMEAGVGFTTQATGYAPKGCYQNYVVDGSMVFNSEENTVEGFDYHEMDWCPQGPQQNCMIQAVCSHDWWDTRKDGTACPSGEGLTMEECQMVFQDNSMFSESFGTVSFTSNSLDLPHGCYGDRTTYGGGY